MNTKNPSSKCKPSNLYQPKLNLEQITTPLYASVDDVVTYTTRITNVGNVYVTNIVAIDLLLHPIELIEDSLQINGLPYPNLNILSGVALGNLDVNESIEVKFKVRVKDYGEITNQMVATYEYRIPNSKCNYAKDYSNVSTVYIIDTELKINMYCDKKSVILNDLINYTIVLRNEGNVELLNVVVKNPLPKYIQLITDSFTVNDQHVFCVDLNKGFTIPTICENETIIIKYAVKVAYTPCSARYTTDLSIKIHYRLPNCCINSKELKPKEQCSVNIGMSTFKQFSIDKYNKIPSDSPKIESINSVKGKISVKDYHVFKTPTGLSSEGQNLTGYKVSILGYFIVQMDYTSCSPLQSVHCVAFEIPFSTFIVLPYEYNPGCGLEISGVVEDIYYNKVDCNTVFISSNALVNVKMLSW